MKEIIAASAIIVMPSIGRSKRDLYIVQKRDPDGGHYPGWWGTFGGKKEPSDVDDKATLFRELKEELGWQPDPDEVVHLGDLKVDYPQPNPFPTFYTHAVTGLWYCPMDHGDYRAICKEEGGMGCFEGQAAVPYSWEGLIWMPNVTYTVIMGAYFHRQWKRVHHE